MCGIITIIRKDGKIAVKQVLKSYEKQKTRGCEGFGYVAIDGNNFAMKVARTESESDIRKELKDETANIIAFHHRQPTSTPNFAEVAHPIIVSNKKLKYNYYVMHNGIITDCDKLKEKHNADGYKYTTTIRKEYITNKKTYYSEMFNDSESFAIELAKAIESGTDKINIGGSIAFVAIQTTKGTDKRATKIFYGRNEKNPLLLDETKDFLRLASENNGKEIDEHKLFCLDLPTMETTERACEFGDKVTATVFGYDDGYRFMASDYDDDESSFVYESDVELEELKIEMRELENQLEVATARADYAKVVELNEAIADVMDEIEVRQNRVARRDNTMLWQ